jgi:hypothetical protein
LRFDWLCTVFKSIIPGAYLLVGSDPDTVIVTLDDDVEYQPRLVEWMVQHMPKVAGAVSGYCEVSAEAEY